MLWTLLLATTTAAADPPRDADGDGISDRTERATGTDPYNRDTDSDGVPDGKEDKNRDGVMDAGESDPRRAGLFPGTAPHIPEPMVFDMVRGMGARQGELEVNVLGLAVLDRSQPTFLWAPEIEWAFAPGHAIELELPLVDRHLEAVKLALQGTLPGQTDRFIQGWQVFAEVALDDGATDAVAVYMLGHRFGNGLSALGMIGGRAGVMPAGLEGAFVFNGSLFYDVEEWLTTGVETNTDLVDGEHYRVRIFPQTHWQISEHFRVQFSGGAEVTPDGVRPVWGSRIILE